MSEKEGKSEMFGTILGASVVDGTTPVIPSMIS